MRAPLLAFLALALPAGAATNAFEEAGDALVATNRAAAAIEYGKAVIQDAEALEAIPEGDPSELPHLQAINRVLTQKIPWHKVTVPQLKTLARRVKPGLIDRNLTDPNHIRRRRELVAKYRLLLGRKEADDLAGAGAHGTPSVSPSLPIDAYVTAIRASGTNMLFESHPSSQLGRERAALQLQIDAYGPGWWEDEGIISDWNAYWSRVETYLRRKNRTSDQ